MSALRPDGMPEPTVITEFVIPAEGVPQGSKTGFVVGKRAVVVDANKALLKPWRALVTKLAAEAHGGRPRIEGAVECSVIFVFVRPKSVKRELMTVKPDGDKLLRALLDGITDAGVWRDDAQVIHPDAWKVYGDSPGVHVRIAEFQHHPTLEGVSA